MRKFLLFFLVLLGAINLSAKSPITVYEYKDEKAYCTFEFDSELKTDSSVVRGTYRAYEFYKIPYYEMTFEAKAYVDELGRTLILVNPIFYYHSYLSKVIGRKEALDPDEYAFTFELVGDVVTDITPDTSKAKIMRRAAFPEKGFIDITSFPESFKKAKSIQWKYISKDLRKNLQNKDKTLGRKY